MRARRQTYWAFVVWGSGLQAVVACGGNQTQGAPGGNGGSSAIGQAGNAGQLAAIDTVQRPPPADDSCARFGLTFTEPACASACPPLPCDAANVDRLVTALGSSWCALGGTAERCWTGFNCQYGQDPDLIACAVQVPCTVDAECAGGGFCIIHAGNAAGECANGQTLARCREPADCKSGHCVAADVAGHRACAEGAEWSFCNATSDCNGGLRCTKVVDSFLGVCTTGEVSHPCFDQASCQPGLSCVQTPAEKVPVQLPVGQCTSGALGEPCRQAEDCASRHCPGFNASTCSAGTLDDRCVEAVDCESGFCGPITNAGRRCVSGDVTAPCDDNGDCKSHHCLMYFEAPPGPSPLAGTCSEGKPGDPCGSSDQCESGVCGGSPGASGSHGVCA